MALKFALNLCLNYACPNFIQEKQGNVASV
jgi:hypothetical protein